MADPRRVRADANALVVELLERLARDEVRELEVKRGGLRVRVAKDARAPAPARPAAAAAPALSTAAPVVGPTTAEPGGPPTVNAPLTGVFYRSPSPQTQPYVQVGSDVRVGEVIGLIEAMKLFNEIRSTADGRVRRILVENGQLVRAHQPLIEVEPA
jgi:acetyl-CoA carboxylase biotin carboxyl carrier protein